MNHVDFDVSPKLGAVLRLDSQAYHLEATEPYVCKGGRASKLLIWRTDCPRCGQRFTLKTGLVAKALNRRCEPCRKRAKSPVSGRKRSVAVKLTREI